MASLDSDDACYGRNLYSQVAYWDGAFGWSSVWVVDNIAIGVFPIDNKKINKMNNMVIIMSYNNQPCPNSQPLNISTLSFLLINSSNHYKPNHFLSVQPSSSSNHRLHSPLLRHLYCVHVHHHQRRRRSMKKE